MNKVKYEKQLKIRFGIELIIQKCETFRRIENNFMSNECRGKWHMKRQNPNACCNVLFRSKYFAHLNDNIFDFMPNTLEMSDDEIIEEVSKWISIGFEWHLYEI